MKNLYKKTMATVALSLLSTNLFAGAAPVAAPAPAPTSKAPAPSSSGGLSTTQEALIGAGLGAGVIGGAGALGIGAALPFASEKVRGKVGNILGKVPGLKKKNEGGEFTKASPIEENKRPDSRKKFNMGGNRTGGKTEVTTATRAEPIASDTSEAPKAPEGEMKALSPLAPLGDSVTVSPRSAAEKLNNEAMNTAKQHKSQTGENPIVDKFGNKIPGRTPQKIIKGSKV